MKIPKKKGMELSPDKHKDYVLIENSLLLAGIPREEFAVWGYMFYSQEVAGRISKDLVYNNKVSKN